MPARTASSTTYWMAGLSTTGSISLGWALVAGRNRVPRPAAGMTALVTHALSMSMATVKLTGLALVPFECQVGPRRSRSMPTYEYRCKDCGEHARGRAGLHRRPAHRVPDLRRAAAQGVRHRSGSASRAAASTRPTAGPRSAKASQEGRQGGRLLDRPSRRPRRATPRATDRRAASTRARRRPRPTPRPSPRRRPVAATARRRRRLRRVGLLRLPRRRRPSVTRRHALRAAGRSGSHRPSSASGGSPSSPATARATSCPRTGQLPGQRRGRCASSACARSSGRAPSGRSSPTSSPGDFVVLRPARRPHVGPGRHVLRRARRAPRRLRRSVLPRLARRRSSPRPATKA